MGPIIISDKSFIEMISINEAVWFDQFFYHNITTIYYMETLADLEKKNLRGRTSAEQLVSEIAHKTPQRFAYPNISHQELVRMSLLGYEVPMTKRPLVPANILKPASNGLVNIQINSFPEIEAFQYWQMYEFEKLERLIAKRWHESIESTNFDKWQSIAKNILHGNRLRNLEEVKGFVNEFIHRKGKNEFYLEMELLDIDNNMRNYLLQIYNFKGMPTLNDFAPYAAYVFKIKLFFHLSILSSLISKESTYKTDIVYLFYLPFCQIFVSNDISHSRMVPLFLENDQKLCSADMLKNALKELNDHYLNSKNEINKVGVSKFAAIPPTNLNNEVTRLWDQFFPDWKRNINNQHARPSPNILEQISKIKAETKQIDKATSFSDSGIESILIQRKVHKQQGIWTLIPSK